MNYSMIPCSHVLRSWRFHSSDANPRAKDESLFEDPKDGAKDDDSEKRRKVEKDSTVAGNDDKCQDVPITGTDTGIYLLNFF